MANKETVAEALQGRRRSLSFENHPNRRYRALFIVRGEEVVILAIRAPGERPIKPEDISPEA